MPERNYRLFAKRVFEDFRELFERRRLTRPPELQDASILSNSLITFGQRWPQTNTATDPASSPIFIFSAGWRSGSTLLQRLLMSSNEVVIWGEPLGDAAFIPRLAYSLSVIHDTWPPDNFIVSGSDIGNLTNDWIANITPDMKYLKSAHKSFIDTWLAEPVKTQFKLNRWGLKEVRLTIDHARYLKWLYPGAKFVFIYRDPFNAFRSWKGNRWRSVWPGYYRNSAYAFAKHWISLLDGFMDGYKELDGFLVKYEDLVSGNINLDLLARHIGVSHIDCTILNKKIGTPKGSTTKIKKQISWLDRAIIYFICRKQLKQHNYL